MQTKTTCSKEKLRRLTDYQENIQNKLITLAIQEIAELYIIIEKTGLPHQLHSGNIERIYNNSPKKVSIIIKHSSTGISPFQYCGWPQTWINIDNVESLIKEDLLPDLANETSKYSTPLLVMQSKAINEFWINYNPKNPPKSDSIVKWLEMEGATTRVAKAIDSIIRPAHLKKGGNRKNNNKQG